MATEDYIRAENRAEAFPINRRHQQVATLLSDWVGWSRGCSSFQSIGVTNKWRRTYTHHKLNAHNLCFQSIGVTNKWRRCLPPDLFPSWMLEFPINRRHQQVATAHLVARSKVLAADVSNQ